MQSLSSRKIDWPKFSTKLRLCLVASITTVVLVIFFSSAAESESGAGRVFVSTAGHHMHPLRVFLSRNLSPWTNVRV